MSNEVNMNTLFGDQYTEQPCSDPDEVISKSASYQSLLSGHACRLCIEVLKNLLHRGMKEADWTLQAPTLVKVMLGLKYEHYKSALLDQIQSELDILVVREIVQHQTAQMFMIACEEASRRHTEILDTSSRMGQVGYQAETDTGELTEALVSPLSETREVISAVDLYSGQAINDMPPMCANNREISASHVALDES